MANSAIFIGWGSVVHGREEKANQVFYETVGYFTQLQQQGEIESFEPIALEPHGGDLAGLHMLGTSGTVTTIAGLHLELPRYDRRRVDGCWLAEEEVTGVVERLMGMSYEERAANPCIGTERADLVIAGCAILEAIRRAFPCPRMRVADRGLREGMLVQMMRRDGVWDSGVGTRQS